MKYWKFRKGLYHQWFVSSPSSISLFFLVHMLQQVYRRDEDKKVDEPQCKTLPGLSRPALPDAQTGSA